MALAVKRAQRDFKALTAAVQAGGSAYLAVRLVKDDDLFNWEVTIAGPPASPYAGGKFHVLVKLSENFPNQAPLVVMKTKMWHPGVEVATGKTCERLFADWAPSMTVGDALEMVVDILRSPAAHEQEVNVEALQQLKEHPAAFNEQAKNWTRMHAQ